MSLLLNLCLVSMKEITHQEGWQGLMPAEMTGGVWLQWCEDTSSENWFELVFSLSTTAESWGGSLVGGLCALGDSIACPAHSPPTRCQGHSLPHNQLWWSQVMDTQNSWPVQVPLSSINTWVFQSTGPEQLRRVLDIIYTMLCDCT